jgi:hypothetical protein
VTAEGGASITSEKFTISKTCVSLKKDYKTAVGVAVTSKSVMQSIALPFLNIDSKDACGVKSIMVSKTLDKGNFIQYPAKNTKLPNCPGPKCNHIEVVSTKEGSFKYTAMAILNDGTRVITKEFNGQVGCSATAPKLTPPKYSNGVIYHLDDRPYEFKPFTTSNSDFPACGFKEYTVTAYNKATRRSVKVEYPPKDNKVACSSLTSCLQAKFDTS